MLFIYLVFFYQFFILYILISNIYTISKVMEIFMSINVYYKDIYDNWRLLQRQYMIIDVYSKATNINLMFSVMRWNIQEKKKV